MAKSTRAQNPHALTEEERRILKRLAEQAEESGDDWGVTQAVAEYLADPFESPRKYLSRVKKDVWQNFGNVGESDERPSAERADGLVARAIQALPTKNPQRLRRLLNPF